MLVKQILLKKKLVKKKLRATKKLGTKSLVKIGSVIAELFLVWTKVAKTNDAWTNVTVTVGVRKAIFVSTPTYVKLSLSWVGALTTKSLATFSELLWLAMGLFLSISQLVLSDFYAAKSNACLIYKYTIYNTVREA